MAARATDQVLEVGQIVDLLGWLGSEFFAWPYVANSLDGACHPFQLLQTLSDGGGRCQLIRQRFLDDLLDDAESI
jgi:hypothetical protein